MPPSDRAAGPANPSQVLRYGHGAAVIREGMQRLELTQATLARKIGVTSKNPSALISPWINAKGAPGPKYASKLAKLFGIPESELQARALPDSNGKALTIVQPATPTARQTKRETPLLIFQVNGDGTARISVDITTDADKALALLRILIDAGIVSGATTAQREDIGC